jgi:carboxylate-amine ligase
MMVRQNKWRAARYGLSATLVDTFDYSEKTVPETANRLVDQLLGVAQDLNCESELLFVREIAAGVDWADRQREIYRATNQRREIVRQLALQSRV